MSFFDAFMPPESQGGGCFGEPKGLNVGDVLGQVGDLYGLGSVWTGLGASVPVSSDAGYRPKEWNLMDATQMVLVKTNIGGLFFDAVVHVDTEESLTITSHPVQNGANISDHAYREPTRITMEIKMSDVMASRVPGQFTGAYTKSVSAYRRLLDLQRSRIPCSVLTRLGSYQNMLIESISAPDDPGMLHGLSCSVSLREVLVANVAVAKVSARQWTTGAANKRGEVQPKPVYRTTARELEIQGRGWFGWWSHGGGGGSYGGRQ